MRRFESAASSWKTAFCERRVRRPALTAVVSPASRGGARAPGHDGSRARRPLCCDRAGAHAATPTSLAVKTVTRLSTCQPSKVRAGAHTGHLSREDVFTPFSPLPHLSCVRFCASVRSALNQRAAQRTRCARRSSCVRIGRIPHGRVTCGGTERRRAAGCSDSPPHRRPRSAPRSWCRHRGARHSVRPRHTNSAVCNRSPVRALRAASQHWSALRWRWTASTKPVGSMGARSSCTSRTRSPSRTPGAARPRNSRRTTESTCTRAAFFRTSASRVPACGRNTEYST